MPTFDTPGPIVATLTVIGRRRPHQRRRPHRHDRHGRPTDASNDEDRKAAEQTRVELVGDQLVVKAPEAAALRGCRGAPAARST